MEDEFIKKARSTIEVFGMLSAGDKVVAAVSGGADSTALLVSLLEFSKELGLTLSVAHVNHMLRGDEADRDAEHTKRLAERFGLKFYLHEADVKKVAEKKALSIQEAGREVRDNFFRSLLEETGAQKVATGHTASDNAETFLMRLITGSGPQGLSGIPPVNPPYIRPLIEVTRSDVEKYLEEKKIDWVTDSSNLEDKYLRNRIRYEIIPSLREINPEVEKSLIRATSEFRNLFDIMRSEVDSFLDCHVRGNTLDIEGLRRLPAGLQSEIIKEIIYRTSKKPIRITSLHIDSVMNLIGGASTGEKSVNLPSGLVARRNYNVLSIAEETIPEKFPAEKFEISIPKSIRIPSWNLIITVDIEPGPIKKSTGKGKTAHFDLNKIKGPLTLRTRIEGDLFYPTGGKGGSTGLKKLTDFFIDSKIPRNKRDEIPILLSGDNIIWVVGMRSDERYAAGPNTKRVIALTFVYLSA